MGHEGGAMVQNYVNTQNLPKESCVDRFAVFVRELDVLLESNPSRIGPVHGLLDKFFPLEGCDIETIIEIARRSRFFLLVGAGISCRLSDISSLTC
jgi:hypothetical protein